MLGGDMLGDDMLVGGVREALAEGFDVGQLLRVAPARSACSAPESFIVLLPRV
jgi:hypothetical protein